MAGNIGEIQLKNLYQYDDSYEVWDEIKKEWRNIKDSCYYNNIGFPSPEDAEGPITLIGIQYNSHYYIFGYGDYDNTRDDVKFIKCSNELDMIKTFLQWWLENYPDIITGWNVTNFDIPYLVNRITRLFGEKEARKLSPWNYIPEKNRDLGNNRIVKTYDLIGISVLDYFDLYQKFAPEGKARDSYRLDNIGNIELGEGKLSYTEYGNLHNLYKENYQKFVDYNIKDIDLVEKLDNKLKLIDLALTLAYDSKCNYDDVFTQVRMWDTIIYNHLREKNYVIPPVEKKSKDSAYIGAFVKEPIIGMHKYVGSFDLTSMYPSLIMQYNLSPETIIEPDHYNDDLKEIISSNPDIDSMLLRKNNTTILKKYNLGLTPNAQFFNNGKLGFMAEITETMFKDRQKYKKLMIEAQKKLEKVEEEINHRKLNGK